MTADAAGRTTPHPSMRRELCGLGVLIGVWLAAAHPAAAQQGDQQEVYAQRFTQHPWSQIFPNFGFQTGCVTGYLAFKFSDDGSFVFNQRVHGGWQVDGQGNLLFRTRDGVRFRLLFDGNNLYAAAGGTGYFRRNAQFQECQ